MTKFEDDGADAAVRDNVEGTVEDAIEDAVEETEERDANLFFSPDVIGEGNGLEEEEEVTYASKSIRDVVEWAAVVIVALVAALVIREYVVQAFEIPSQSMEPTVNVGDRILVNKLSYSFGDVQRGDLVVFERGELIDGDTDELIKRAIALPGETISLRDGEIFIAAPGDGPEDAVLLNEPYLDPRFSGELRLNPTRPTGEDIWHENCLNDREVGRCVLDDDSFYFLGDNRLNSADSRTFGPVPEENVVGRAFFRIWPWRAVGTL